MGGSGGEGRKWWGGSGSAGPLSPFAHAGPSSPFVCASVGTLSVHRVHLLFVVVWLFVFGSWWLWLPSCRHCPLSLWCTSLTCHYVMLCCHCCMSWVVLLLALVGYCGGSSLLVMSLHCSVGLVGCLGCLWMLVGLVGHHGVWMSAGGSDYVGRDGGAHQ